MNVSKVSRDMIEAIKNAIKDPKLFEEAVEALARRISYLEKRIRFLKMAGEKNHGKDEVQ